MKTIRNLIKKGRLRIATLLLMIVMIIGTGQTWGAAPEWIQMGVRGINGVDNANASSVVIVNGTPYLAYTAYTGAGVVKYDGTNWVTVGASFLSTECNNVAMVASGSTLYVAYSNVNFGRIEVKKCDTASGSTWTDLGIANGSKALSIDSPLTLAVNSDSDIYLGYTDYSTSLFKVFHYNGSAWAYQFNTNGSAGCITSVNGVAYAAYQDGSNNRLNQNSGSGWTQIQALSGIPQAICNDGSGKLYILTEDRSSSPTSLAVVCYDISSNTCTIVGSHIPVSSAYSPSISVDNGTVYVMYYISGGTSFLYAYESTADWVQVSSLSSAYYGDMTAKDGIVYYGYSNLYALAAKKMAYPIPVPKVTGISPDKGPEAGGTSVTITGSNFTGATAVNFGATPAASFTVNSVTSITATAPAGTGTVDVTVTVPAGTSAVSSNDRFTYYQKPSVTDISPTSGPAAGGTSVTITGTNLTGATAVSFGATPAASFTVSSATSITATAPAGTGTVDVTVTGPGGTSDDGSSDQFTYIQGPAVTGVSPVSGPAAGGTSITITGTNFTGATAVSFGATPAVSFTVSSSTSITATAPAGTGMVDVTVTGPGGTSATSSNDRFTYIQAPAVTGISPAGGPTAGGTSVTITGTNFTGTTAVSFGATPAASFTVNSAASITATAPAGTGTVDVTVTGPGGSSATSLNDRFTYYQKPAVTGISPSVGPLAGGNTVTITGTNFTGATAVSFGATPAASYTVNSATSITATAPAGTGTVDITITGPGGTSTTSSSDRYTYQTTYTVSIGTISGGAITASPTNAAVGATINLTVTPASGKQLKAGTLKYNDGTDHSITGASFTMPAANATVTAEFETIPAPPAPTGGSGSSSSDKPKTDMSVSGNTSVATTAAKATVDSSGKASAAVSTEQMSDAVSKAVAEVKKQDNGTSAVVEVKVEGAKDAKAVETKVPKAAVDTLVNSSIAQLNVSTPVADIAFDSSALSAISSEASGDIKITASKVEASALSTESKQVVGNRPVFNFSVTSGDKTISQFGGNVSVAVPYSPKPGEDTNAIVIYYINAEGKPEMVSDCVFDAASGSITFNTNHFSQYAVGYNPVTFKDVAADAWYSEAVSYIAAREITTGTGNGYFNPKAKLTRGQFIVMLMKAYGIAPDRNPKDNFSDAGSTYYTGYLAAAKRLGITSGVGNNMSAPEKEITRQEMFTLMYNALKVIDKLPQGNSGESLSSYSDSGNIASWAKDAVELFAETGTISGSGNKLSPQETTTRAQMAQVLYSLLSK